MAIFVSDLLFSEQKIRAPFSTWWCL